MIRSADHHDGAEPVLVAPAGKRWTFVLASGYICGDEVDGLDAQRSEASNGSCGLVFVGDPAPDELTFHRVRRFAENCDSRGHAAANKVGGFERPGAAGLDRHDNDVGGFDAVIDNERPSSRPQNGSSKGGYSNAGSAQQHDYQYKSGT